MKRKRRRKKRIIIPLVIILLVIGGILALMLGGRNMQAPVVSENMTPLMDKVIDSFADEKPLEVNNEDLNNLKSVIFKDTIKKGKLTIKDVYFDISDQSIRTYMPVSLYGVNLLLTSEEKIKKSGDKIIVEPQNFKVGNLPIPKSIVMSELKKYSNGYADINSGNVVIDTKKLPIDINNINIENKKIVASIGGLEENVTKTNDNNDNSIDYQTSDNKSNPEKKDSNDNSSLKQSTKANSSNKPKQDVKSESGKLAKRTAVLRKTSGQVAAASASCPTGRQKQVLGRVQSTIGKMIANPSYSYKRDIPSVKSAWSKLSDKEKEQVKDAILSRVDTKAIMEVIDGK